jgi:hypothetical protein
MIVFLRYKQGLLADNLVIAENALEGLKKLAETPEYKSGEIIFYSTSQSKMRLEVFFQEETFWLSQKKLGELFGVDVRTISEHLRNIYNSNELEERAIIRKFRIVQTEGSREIDCYDLISIRSTLP